MPHGAPLGILRSKWPRDTESARCNGSYRMHTNHFMSDCASNILIPFPPRGPNALSANPLLHWPPRRQANSVVMLIYVSQRKTKRPWKWELLGIDRPKRRYTSVQHVRLIILPQYFRQSRYFQYEMSFVVMIFRKYSLKHMALQFTSEGGEVSPSVISGNIRSVLRSTSPTEMN